MEIASKPKQTWSAPAIETIDVNVTEIAANPGLGDDGTFSFTSMS